ncbi:MAG TPA: tRNA uridine-5-carboxymethylaminomethyl(34) synthesis GTPase MnmE [Chloroflexota bacterium]|nr:tRNA uridine-5-carboxymethylaminomethyl(34) synthesis GTPase MnmE [Chloroflexota bacterium]
MAPLRLDDTIAAIATPLGEGAIGMVRLSGPQALAIAESLFRPSRPRRRRGGWASHRLYHGHIVDPLTGRAVDEVLLAYMRGPRTYTRQDVVEITGHGSVAGMREILRLTVAAGARPAERGEMTLRAFLSGRLDLAQAEAVLDAVRARTPRALSLATQQLGGGLSRAVSAVRQELVAILAHLEATIDFAEDDVPPPAPGLLLQRLDQAAGRLERLLATARAGRLHREGLRVAIVGRPNVGKSSLLNAMLQEERAIVTAIPGTTRDVIEEAVDVAGLPLVLVDTAGITETDDPVERIGVARSREAMRQADLILLVLDVSRPLDEADRAIASLVAEVLPAARTAPVPRPASRVLSPATRDSDRGTRDSAPRESSVLVVWNKVDLAPAPARHTSAPLLPGVPEVRVSALTGEGLDSLRQRLHRAALGQDGVQAMAGAETIVSSTRHRDALERAALALAEARRAVERGLAADFVCIDLREAVVALGTITGESVTEDLLTSIFSQFCIGK